MSDVARGSDVHHLPVQQEIGADPKPAKEIAHAQQAYWNKVTEEGRLGVNRIWLGNTAEKGASLQLKDASGRVRMLLLVGADGKAEIQMLDEAGKVVRSITPSL